MHQSIYELVHNLFTVSFSSVSPIRGSTTLPTTLSNLPCLPPQSDIVHQSVYELVHSEDREELQRQLMWNSHLPPDQSQLTLQEALHGDQVALERNFTVRFRCLLDNTSGFLVSAAAAVLSSLVGLFSKVSDHLFIL